jgi:hypothetical protein
VGAALGRIATDDGALAATAEELVRVDMVVRLRKKR